MIDTENITSNPQTQNDFTPLGASAPFEEAMTQNTSPLPNTAHHPSTSEHNERQVAHQGEMEQALWQTWQESYEAGKAEIPDLEAALRYLSQVREQHLTALARVDTRLSNPEIRAQQMREDLRAIVAASVEARENPARIIYELAHGFGYGMHHAATRLDHLGEAQRGARTITASNGREAGHLPSLEALAHLGEEEFARWYEGNAHNFRQMFGG